MTIFLALTSATWFYDENADDSIEIVKNNPRSGRILAEEQDDDDSSIGGNKRTYSRWGHSRYGV